MDLKSKARAYYTAVSRYDQEIVTAMVDTNYIQHNVQVPTGRTAFVDFLHVLKAHNTKIHNIRMLQDGRHVIMHHMWTNGAPFGANELAAFHIIRFDEQNLIAEHWNVMTPLLSSNPSGRTLLDGPFEVTNRDKTRANRAATTNFVHRLIQADPRQLTLVFTEYCNKDFMQHHPAIADGIDGLFFAVDSGILQADYQRVHAVFAEGQFTLVISEGLLNGVHTAFYDLLRFDHGKVAEHWSIYQNIPKNNLANSNTMFGF